MKKFVKILFLFVVTSLFSVVGHSQNAASGSGYTLTRPSGTDCSLSSGNTVRFGNGTSGWVEVCLEVNSLVATCGGGNNKDDQVYLYQDNNNDGVPETFMNGFTPTTSVGSCFMTTTSNGYVWLLFCPAGTCDAGDKASSSIRINWKTISSSAPSNDQIGSSTTLNLCGVDFQTNNIIATTTGNCNGTNAGPPTNSWYNNNFDCNGTTQFSAGYTGGDVPYTVENDIWYKFCPGITGTWTVTLSPVRCYDPSSFSPAINTERSPIDTVGNGYQYALFQGTTTNLGSVLTYGSNVPGVRVFNINVTDLTKCYYLEIDGYAGNGCIMNMSMSAPGGICTVLPVKLLTFDGFYKDGKLTLKWLTASEINNSHFSIEKMDNIGFWEILDM